MKKCFIWLLVVFSVTCLAENNFYDFLGTMFMKSGEMQSESSSVLVQSDKKDKKKKKVVDLRISSVKEIEQKVIFVELLKRLHADETMQLVLSCDAIEQLDIIGSAAEKATLAKCLAPHTVFGEVMAAKLLSQPLTDITSIKARQKTIKTIAENDLLRVRLTKALEEISEGQEKFFSFFNNSNILDENVLKQVYGGYEWMQKQSAALYVSRLLTNTLRFVVFAPGYCLTVFGDLIKGWQEKSGKLEKTKLVFKTPFTSLYDYSKSKAQAHDPRHYVKIYKGTIWVEIAEELKKKLVENNQLSTTGGPIFAEDFSHFSDALDNVGLKKGWKPTAIAVGTTVLVDAVLAYCMYKVIKEVKSEHAIFTNMQTRLMGAAAVARGLREINTILNEYPELAATMPVLHKIHELFITRSEVGRLMNVLCTDTFVGNPSFFSNSVHILLAYKLMDEHKKVFCPALEAVGELDAFVAVSCCLRSTNRGLYSLANFVDTVDPVISLENFWNPLMNSAYAVTNTVHLGADYDRNMLITGPNGSGKSTNMKAIAYNILLAQTFGIVAAQHAELTPFNVFNVYLTIHENLKENKSSFMAEAQLLNHICERVTAVPVGQRGFSIIDEGLRGTVAQEAALRLSQAIRKMVDAPRNICVLATHLEEPTHIEMTSNGKIANYYVGLEEPVPGSFVRTFKLIRGVNRWWFDDAARRGRFVDWLVKNTA